MITDTYHPGFDGIVRYLDYLIPQLLQKGHEVSVVCPWFKGNQHYSSPEEGFEIIRTTTTRFRSNAYYWAIPDWRLIKAIIQSDFIVLHSLMPLGLAGGLVAKLFRKKIGFWCHHDERVIFNDILQLPSFLVRLFYKFIEKFYTKIVDVFFHATERFRRKLVYFGAPSDKTHHTPFAINTSKFHSEPEIDLRKRYSIPSDAIITCYLGRLSVEKNVDNILLALDAAMEDVPNLFALIVGGGPDEEKYLALPRKNNERFIFTGFIPENELQSHYATSDIFVTPTLNESSCFTVFESMTCNVPVITSAMDHDPDIIDRENALLVYDVLNPSEIKENLLRLATNESFRKRIAMNGQKLISSRTWENHSERFVYGMNTVFSANVKHKKSVARVATIPKNHSKRKLGRIKKSIGL